MAKTSTSWQPGQSGNLKGKPPKHRELTEILKRAGSHTVEVDGKKITGKHLVALKLWELATTGQTTLPDGTEDGRKLTAEPAGWFDIVKFVYGQIDGAPSQNLQVSGTDGGPVELAIVERIVDADKTGD